MTTFSDNMRGALFMSLSMAGFVANDTLVKLASPDIGVFQLLFVRGIMATALIGLMAWRSGALRHLLARRDKWALTARICGEMLAATTFMTALYHMPLANVTAVLQAGPLAITLGAALIFGEPLGWRRISAIVIGFIGVLLIVRPASEGFNVYSLLALGTVLFVTVRELSTRRLSPGVPSLLVVLMTSVAVTLMGGAVAAFGDWSPLTPRTLAILAGSAVAVTIGYFFGVKSVRIGEIGFVAPFRYAVLIWAIILGYVVFGNLPDWLTIAGSALIVGSGIYSLRRERKLARMARMAARDRVEGARGVT